MKKALFIAALFAAALAVSCKQELNIDNATPEARITRTFNCVLVSEPDSKVSIDAQGKTKWEAGDEILIHAGNDGNEREIYTLAAEDISADGKTAKVATTLDPYIHYSSGEKDYTSTYYAIYPASATINPDPESSYPFQNQQLYYETRIENFSEPVIGACDDGEGNFLFYNVCGVISFTVSGGFDTCEFSGNGDEAVGYNVYQCRIAMKINGDMYLAWPKYGNGVKATDVVSQKSVTMSVKGDGTTVHTICIPGGVNLSGGFTMKFYDGEELVKIASSTTGVDVKRGTYLNLGDITSHLKDYEAPSYSDHRSAITGAKDLSSVQANCYVITAPGAYKLPVLKGNSEDSAGSVFGAEIVWETYNNTTEVVENSIIAAVDFDGPDNFVYFKTPETLKSGNALIAAKNDQGKIIWSWHIWIPETAITNGSAELFGTEVMDRNLGALTAVSGTATAESCGFLYQWGRKDPFPGVGQMSANTGSTAVFSHGTDKSLVQLSVAQSIQNPSTFAYNSETAVDPSWKGLNWCSADLADPWGTAEAKGLYDPCPAGYRVPMYDSSLPGFGTEGWTYDYNNFLYSHSGVVFPYAGYLDDCSGNVSHGGDRSAFWSAKAYDTDRAYSIDVRLKSGATAHTQATQYKARGNSVRCVVE